MEPSTEPIIERQQKLSNIVNSCGVDETASLSLSSKQFPQQLLAKEGLLDALLLLYDECSNDTLIKIPNVSSFVEKCKLFNIY